MAKYMTLGNYNSYGVQKAASIHPPVAVGTPSMMIQTVPVYSMPGYQALTHNNQLNGSGYFSIRSAYPNYDNSCDVMAQRGCASCLS